MATNNSVDVSLSGQTGTGTFVGSSSPTLVTPTLGAALATSINFGGSTLSTYVSEGTWTPVFTFATVGNLSVSYTTQFGWYTQIGSIVYYLFRLGCTPTFTTSSGNFIISGLPVASNSNASNIANSVGTLTGATAWPASTTYLTSNVQAGVSVINIYGWANTGPVAFATTNFTTGSPVAMNATGFYFV